MFIQFSKSVLVVLSSNRGSGFGPSKKKEARKAVEAKYPKQLCLFLRA